MGSAKRMTRRQYMIFRALEKGASPVVAQEAVASTALAHPEWNMNEKRSWDDWELARERGYFK